MDIELDFSAESEDLKDLKLKLFKNEEISILETSDYAEEEDLSIFNSLATNNTTEVNEASVQDIKPSLSTQPVITEPIFSENHLRNCIKNLLAKLDCFKADMHTIDCNLIPSTSLSQMNTDVEETIVTCRRQLSSVIILIEDFSGMQNFKNSANFCRALDKVYRTLCSIKEQLLKLNINTTHFITHIETIINYSNSHIRNVALALDDMNVKSENDEDECVIICEIKKSSIKDKLPPKIIYLDHSDVDYEAIIKGCSIKLERLESENIKIEENILSSDNVTFNVESDSSVSIADSKDPSYHPSQSSTECVNESSSDSSKDKLKQGKQKDLDQRIISDFSDESDVKFTQKSSCGPKHQKKMGKEMDEKMDQQIISNFSDESEKKCTQMTSSGPKYKKKRDPHVTSRKKKFLRIISSSSSDESDTTLPRQTKKINPRVTSRKKKFLRIISLSSSDESDTTLPRQTKKINKTNIVNENKFNSNINKGYEKGDYPQSDLSSCDEDSTNSEPEILWNTFNDTFPQPKLNMSRIIRKRKTKLMQIKKDMLQMLQ